MQVMAAVFLFELSRKAKSNREREKENVTTFSSFFSSLSLSFFSSLPFSLSFAHFYSLSTRASLTSRNR